MKALSTLTALAALTLGTGALAQEKVMVGEPSWPGAKGMSRVIGQVIEGNVLTPKLVGDSVGLHPVWLIFALSVFGSLFGFIGMLVAVPLAASLGVIMRFLVGQYTDSKLYRGLSDGDHIGE